MSANDTGQPRRTGFLAGMLHYDDGLVGIRSWRDRPALVPRTVVLRILGAILCLLTVVLLLKAAELILITRDVNRAVLDVHSYVDGSPYEPPHPAVLADWQARQAWRTAERIRHDRYLQFLQPWMEAGETRWDDLEARTIRYAAKMHTSPTRCREALRSRLPAGWAVEAQSLGESVAVGRPGRWRVSGILTVDDQTGARHRHHYRCDFVGSDLTEILLADPITLENAVSLFSGR